MMTNWVEVAPAREYKHVRSTMSRRVSLITRRQKRSIFVPMKIQMYNPKLPCFTWTYLFQTMTSNPYPFQPFPLPGGGAGCWLRHARCTLGPRWCWCQGIWGAVAGQVFVWGKTCRTSTFLIGTWTKASKVTTTLKVTKGLQQCLRYPPGN